MEDFRQCCRCHTVLVVVVADVYVAPGDASSFHPSIVRTAALAVWETTCSYCADYCSKSDGKSNKF